MTLRVCLAAAGRPRELISLSESDTLEDLYRTATQLFGECRLQAGFPPQVLDCDSLVVAQSLIAPNERVTVILAPDKLKQKSKENERFSLSMAGEGSAEEAGRRRSKRAAARAATESFPAVIKAQNNLAEKTSKRKLASNGTMVKKSSRKRNTTSAKLARLPGRRLGDGAAVGPPERRRNTPGGTLKNEDDVSFALMRALENGGGGKVGQVLRGAMRNAVSRQYDATRALARVSAVHGGNYRLEEKNGSLIVSFDKGLEGRGEYEEVVDCIPRDALQAVIEAIQSSDPESLREITLSQLSPRVFWSVIHVTNQQSSVEQGLKFLLPRLDWSFLRRRKQMLSEKARENLRQEKMANGEDEPDSRKAEEVVHAVEEAMDQLHQYDKSRRRNRIAEAAVARFSETWRLKTPTEVDEDELEACIGVENRQFAGALIRNGISNWRQLANARADEIRATLSDMDSELVEAWIDRAQQESIEEIVVEICDGRTEVVEVLRDEGRSGTPKDLANWRSIPDLLLQSAPSLVGLGVSVRDVAAWSQRAVSVLDEWEWTNWYATPVE